MEPKSTPLCGVRLNQGTGLGPRWSMQSTQAGPIDVPQVMILDSLQEHVGAGSTALSATLRCAFTDASLLCSSRELFDSRSPRFTHKTGHIWNMDTPWERSEIEMLKYVEWYAKHMLYRLDVLQEELRAAEDTRKLASTRSQGIRLSSEFPTPYELARKYTSCIEMQGKVLEELLQGELQPAALLLEIEHVYARVEEEVEMKCQELAAISCVEPDDPRLRYSLQNTFPRWVPPGLTMDDDAFGTATPGLRKMRQGLVPIFVACAITEPPIKVSLVPQDAKDIDKNQFLDMLPQKNATGDVVLALPALVWNDGQNDVILAKAKYLWEPTRSKGDMETAASEPCTPTAEATAVPTAASMKRAQSSSVQPSKSSDSFELGSCIDINVDEDCDNEAEIEETGFNHRQPQVIRSQPQRSSWENNPMRAVVYE
ncbi:hypothetical protein PTSG_10885 [Salpingoeca rosetta]|uniref:Uncharacterized protein n=1 Tax=Salpingoeca rosetta (strain ATCC 50818 / BSB-021) TaxID=946362 RepID=F2URA3_SALR5|nr:uncharacterized protein PTSG_10885 [Salpingoeca rosetta]EGD80206.1 hypothetical protein PTSG_10885 [Salpingoeca rosetta]|eukprot:XP_004988268.1 hypothetical protein PTSG_10885 [Salpingoeca rosetta]